MSEPSRDFAAERLREFLAGRLPEAESQRIEEALAGGEIPAALLESLESDDMMTQSLREEPTVVEQADEEAIVAELTERIRRLRTVPVGETPRGGLEEATIIFDAPRRYPFLRPAETPEELGRLGPYRVLGVLGEGGMGVVFRAEETSLDRAVALKVIKPELARDPEARQRFLREARSAAALNHDHVVPIYRVGEDGDVSYLAMPLLRGESLADRLDREGSLPPCEVLRIGKEAASALAAAHQRGLIHRDVKPGNIWLESPGGRVKLLDFGLARPDRGSDLTDVGTVAGTPAYMAPEQVRGRPEPRSDLFGLGCVLYHMATGEPPFGGEDTLEVLANLAVHEPRPPREINVEIPEAISRLIEKILAKEPHHRHQTAEQVILEIEAIQRGLATAPPVDQVAVVPSFLTPIRGAVAVLAVFVAVVLGVLLIRITRPDGKVQQIEAPSGSTVEVIDGHQAVAGDSEPTTTARPPLAEWFVDDGDAGYTDSGGWIRGTLAEGFQGDYLYLGKGANLARWSVGSLPAGSYEVFVTWVPHPHRAFRVPYTVFDGETSLKTVDIDQQQTPEDEQSQGVGWKSLGVYRIGSGAVAVELDAARCKSPPRPLGKGAVADAVRVVARPEAAGETPDHAGPRKETP